MNQSSGRGVVEVEASATQILITPLQGVLFLILHLDPSNQERQFERIILSWPFLDFKPAFGIHRVLQILFYSEAILYSGIKIN